MYQRIPWELVGIHRDSSCILCEPLDFSIQVEPRTKNWSSWFMNFTTVCSFILHNMQYEYQTLRTQIPTDGQCLQNASHDRHGFTDATKSDGRFTVDSSPADYLANNFDIFGLSSMERLFFFCVLSALCLLAELAMKARDKTTRWPSANAHVQWRKV